MPNNDSHHHVVKTTEQWQDRAVEYWVVPRGTLCVELTPEKKTKIKIGEGSKYYSQLPYICDGHDMSNYYTKEETDRLLDNLNRMAIQSTDVYDTKDDLPLDGNKLGDVRFVKSTSEQKVDPDVYLWNGSKWIYVGYDFANIDLDRYLTKTEFHSEFDPVRDKVDEMYPKMHTHDNKDVLDRTERPFTIADKEKLDSLENYDDTEIRELIRETGHVHWNKHILDTITEDKLWTVQDREKFESLHNYDDTELRNRMGVVESKTHTHTNKDILDQTTAPFKTEDKQKLDSLENYDIFIGTDGRYPGVKGLVPAPSTMDIGKFLSSSGEWELAGINTPFVGATPTTDGVIGLVPAPLMGEQSYYLRGDGTWAKVKSGGDKYKAGEGIYILSGEVATDTFPFKVYSKSGHLEQYIIYGNTGGVGDAMTGGVYGVNITITDEHGNSSNTSVILPEKISLGDYIDYGRQVFVHMRTNVSSLISSVDPSYNWRWAIRPDGSIQYTDIGAYGSSPQVTSLIELEPGITYELYHECNYSPFANYMNLNVYDTEQNRTRTMNFYDPVGNVPTIIALASNEKYIRLTYEHGNAYPYTLIRVKAVETPITLPQIPLFPNSINTINVTNTIKPAEIYVEVAEPSEDDPDDPMSDFTGIIYNDGVLDITQEDPNALNELTVHFRDDVDKVITIPETPLEPATTTTLGGIIVGENLTIDENGVLDATGGGTTYVEGDGIEFGRPILETYQVLDKIRKPSGTTLTTDVMPSGTVDFFCDLKYYKYSGNSFLILCYDGERGSFCYTPAPTASGGWARMWIYTAHENWYDLYLNGSFASSSPIVAHLRWGNTMSMSFDHTSTSAQNTPGVLPGHNRFKFDTSSDVDLYWAKFYENSALVGELIPVIRQSDNVVGLFNTVTETFSTVSGLSAGTPTGETIVIYDQSSTQNIPINAKLGDGLDFDSNDAIEVQPATTTTIGGIIVGENLTIDENGVLSATGGGGVLYDAGDGIEFTYNHMIDMLFDRTAFLDSVTSVQRGTISKDAVTGAFTITATGNDAYTYPDRSSLGTVYSIQVDPNTTYKLTWTSDDPTVHGNVFVFENGDIITSYLVDQATSNELTFITSSTCQTLNFRFGVQNSGDSLTYSDISLYKITEDATINAKLGNGLRFDSNGAIETIGGTQYEAGTGINIISDSGSTVSRTLKVNARTAQANDYTIYGASGGVGDPSINLMPQLTTSSIWADTWYADGTHEGEPAFSKNTWYGGITNEVYLTEGTYTFSLDVKLSSTSVQGLLANELNDQSRYPHYNQAATVDIMHYGPFYPVDTDWHRYSYTFEVTSAGYVACRAENVSAEHGTISVARPQLERGSVAHDYVEHDCYTIPITVSAPNETDIEVFIETSAPLGNGDSLNFIDDALPTLPLYQNKINTITVNTTVAPSRFSVDASSGSDVVSVIENDGILDVTQEDPNALNELTFHYRDNVDKVITIPSTPLEPATTTTLGGIIVGDNLVIDENGVLSATGGGSGGENYEAGEAIRFTKHTPEILPAAYQLVDYIQSTGEQGIELNYIPASSYIKYELTFSDIVFVNTDFHYLIGGYADTVGMRAPSIDYNFSNWPNKVAVPCGRNDPITNGEIPSDMTIPHTYTLTVSNGTVSLQLDDGVVRTGSYSGNISQKVGLFCSPSYTAGDPSAIFQTSAYRFRELKIYEGNSSSNLTLIHHYYPCYRISDDVPGIYDVVTDTFLTNVGTGDLIIGTITGTPVINVQHGDGLEVDANNDLNVKIGNGLYFDANGAITVSDDGTTYQAGQGIEIEPSPSTRYTEIEYLKSTGTQYIKTDIIVDYTMKTELDMFFGDTLSADTTGTIPFGVQANSAWYIGAFEYGTGVYDNFAFYDGYSWSSGMSQDHVISGVSYNTRSTIIIQRDNCSYGADSCTLTIPVTLNDPINPVSVFGVTNGSAEKPFTLRDMTLYGVKIYDSHDNVIHDLVPVKRVADSVVGLYDTITNKFYTNTGTGSFVAGNDIGPVQSDSKFIDAKLGNGLQFDANDAIEVQPATENSIGGIKVGEGLSVAQDGTLDVITDVITTFAEGDAIEFGTTPVPLTETITHIKWAINTIRNRSLNIIQASEIEFYDENDQLLTFSAVSGAFSPSVSTRPTYGTNQYSQTPDKLVDGSTEYKCCCTNFTSNVPEIEFTFELSTPINAQDLKNYRWFTADDQEGRDPISWEVYVSPNGGDWICVHEVTNATVPTARQTSTEYYTVNKPSFSERTINVKYGAGLRLDANGALEVVPGGGLTAGHGIEIDQTSHINDKLGVGLTFDSDDAVTLDETTDLIFNCDYSE